VLPGFRQAGAGKIITIGSLAGLMAIPFNAFYCATKFALEAYMEALWYEVAPFGIAVSLIEPGFVRTGISHSSKTPRAPLSTYDGPRSRSEEAVRRAVEDGLSPEKVAKAVLNAAKSRAPKLRYRVGPAARWLPRLRDAVPWDFFASGVRKTFALDGQG